MTELDRKDFLKLTITVVGTACFAPACGEEDPPPSGTGGFSGAAGSGAPGGAGMSTGGSATGGTATGGTATGGTATGGTATGGAGGAGSGSGGAGSGGGGAGGTAGGGSGGAAGSGAGAGGGGMSGAGGGGGRGGMGGGRGGMSGAGGGGGGMCADPVMTSQNAGNHTHTLTIMAAQINAGMPTMFTVSMAGQPAHPHTVTLTADDFMQLRMGMSVTKTSSTDSGHSHMYTIECA